MSAEDQKMMVVRCIRPPAENRKQGISMTVAGEIETVPDDGFWRGLIADGRIVVVESGKPRGAAK
jgi:hypothetical protein